MSSENVKSAYVPRLVAWEVTKRCAYRCRHCRASATDSEYPGELRTEECLRVIDSIASFARPIVILTGGDPLMRDDIFDIAAYGSSRGLRMVMAPCGQLVNAENLRSMMKSGIQRISLSLDGADPETHDSFRQVEGSFDAVLRSAAAARKAGLSFQINTTVTRLNYHQLGDILRIAEEIGAVGFHPFFLVPTGRGKELDEYEIPAAVYERVLTWIYHESLHSSIELKPTCAPHYYRILHQKMNESTRGDGDDAEVLTLQRRGCLGGHYFAFISNTGKVQACGFLDVEAGDLRTSTYDMRSIWEESELFLAMRDADGYGGKCGLCEYRVLCGGCRARAFAAAGDYLAEEPYCVYVPKGLRSAGSR